LIEESLVPYESGEPESYERTLPGGRTLQFYVAPTPEGGYVSILTDITERKRAEEAQRESEEQVRLLLDSTAEAIYGIDIDGECTFCNPVCVAMLGYDGTEDLLGRHIHDLVHHTRPDGTPYPAEECLIYQAYREGEGTHVDNEVLWRKDGTSFPAEYWSYPIKRDDRVIGAVVTFLDITERKRAEEALLEAKRRSEEASKLVAEKNRMLESLSNQLSKYLSPQVYASIFSGEQSVEITSKRKKLTVFFSDIADFTGTTDSLESEELTNLLNRYLTEMSKIALDHGATIDKYVGDAIIAFFGDPETRGVKEDARACVNMAIAMQRRMQELQSEWLDMGLERPFELRIGINTGFCTVGNFGSEDRMDYTIIGNEVNLAARLESLAEVGGILLAHETHALVKNTVLAEEGDTLTVKGFAKPVRTYSVVGLYDDLAERGRIIRMNQEGLALEIDRGKLTKKSKAEAIKAIKKALSQLEG
jgi:PAS domain S-box-containing protein